MRIPKRSLPAFILLNCLTLGIYGFITAKRIGREIDGICQGDGEQPRLGYGGAVLVRAIPAILGYIVGLIVGLVGTQYMYGSARFAYVMLIMAMFGVGFSVVGARVSGIYLDYWWYRQTGRLRNNAFRYGMQIKETGTDTYLFRTVFNALMLPFTALLFGLALLIPGLIIWLLINSGSIGAVVFATILLFLVSIPFNLFGMELTAGANFSFLFLFKNLNRYADAVQAGAYPYNPMGYSYYPSVESKYPNYQPDLNNGAIGTNGYYVQQIMSKLAELEEKLNNVKQEENKTIAVASGKIIGLSGSCAGYEFDLGGSEELVIGKDAKVSQIVIDPSFKQVSRKHVGICFDPMREQYRVTDYSSNGTLADGVKMEPSKPTYLRRGTILSLADEKNTFRLS